MLWNIYYSWVPVFWCILTPVEVFFIFLTSPATVLFCFPLIAGTYQVLIYSPPRIKLCIEFSDTTINTEISCLHRDFRIKTLKYTFIRYYQMRVLKWNIRILLQGEEHHTTNMYETLLDYVTLNTWNDLSISWASLRAFKPESVIL